MSDLPGGVITTHCVSTVVRPGSKQNHDPLQFVKIQSTELSQKAVEQIRLAEAVKITKEKIKEVEEEWQNNLLNWKSKRRQSRLTGGEESDSGDNQQRKIKTFSEILNEKAKSGQRIGYNLHKYIGMQDEEEEENLVITNNNNNNNDKRGSSRFSNGKNGSGDYLEDDDSNQFKNYEQQQAELQKKRQELNNKLQELEQLEKKQNELERQERINSPSSEISSPSPQLSSNTSETARNDSPTVIVSIENKERQSNLSTANVAKNCEIKQKQNDGYSDKKVFNFNSSSELTKREEYNCEPVSSAHENRQKSVWNYLLQQQDDPRVVHHSHIDPNSDMNQPNLRPNSQYINADSESDDDHLNDSMDADEAAEKEQMLSFRAKLSTFESLSKSDASAQQQPSKQVKKSEKVKRTADQITSRLFPTTTSANSCSPSSSQTSSCTTLSAAATPTVSIQNLKDLENNSVIKNRPPTVEDLAHKEEMKVLQQRLQNQNIGEQQKHFHSTQQPTLPVNSINQNSHQKLHPIQQQANLDKSWNQNSPSHLPLNQMSKVCNPQVNNSNNSLVHPHQQHHYHSRTSSEETRESSSTWETSNFVCDKEVEKISERMNRGNVIPAEFGGNGHETITSTSVHYNNSGPPGLPATSMNQHYHSSSHLSHPHLLQQQRSQYAYDQVKMNRHSVPNLNGPGRGYDQQQYYLMNEIIGDNQQMLANNNGNVNNTHNPVANNNSNMNNNNNFTINNNIINSNGNNSNLNNGNNVNTTEDNYYSNQEQIDLIKKQMMLQKQNSYLNESTASYMQHASKSQSNLNGAQISNLSGQQQQPSELTTSPTYLPIHQQRAVNQSLLRYHQHQYQASINPPMQPMSHSVHSGLPQQSQKQANLQQQSDQQQLYSNYSAAHHMGKSQSTPNMSCQLTNQLQPQAQQCSPYNINHWVIQEAELRRLHYTQQQGPALMARSTAINKFPQPSQVNPNAGNTYENHVYENSPFRGSNASGLNRIPNHPAADTMLKKSNGLQVTQTPIQTVQQGQPQPQPTQQSQQQSPSHGPLQLAQPLQSQQLHQQQQQQKQMLSVSGKKKCSNCGDELGRGCAAMVIETLALYYHINCFRCSVCHIQLGNGTCGTDVRVRNHKLHCHNCYSNDEAGLKFSRV